MKKKLLSLILVGVMTMTMLTACGGSKETPVEEVATDETSEAEAVEETTEETTPEPTPEEEKETTLGYVTTEEESEVEEYTIVPETEEFTADTAMQKVGELFNARNELFANGKVDTDLNFLVAAETLTGGIKLTGITTADGINTDNDADIKIAVICNYFYDYVNNDSGYYDLGEYLTSNTSEDIFNKYWNGIVGGGNTNNTMMEEAPAVIPYLLENLENVNAGELIVGEECTAAPVSDIEVYYEMPILINGEKCGVTAVFDKAGNLLNLITLEEEGWSEDNYRDSTDEVLALNK